MIDRARTLAVRVAVGLAVLRSERGASMVEYSLLVAFIAIVAIVAVAVMGQTLNSEYDRIGDSIVEYG